MTRTQFRYRQWVDRNRSFGGAAQIATLILSCLLVGASAPATASEAPFTGTWAILKVLSDSATFPLVGELARTSTLIQRAAIVQTGSLLVLSATYCSTTFDNGSALRTTVDQAFARSLAPIVLQATLDDSSDPEQLTQSWATELHGVRLENPETDPLPTYAGDPRVFDQDGDGRPGITVRACALGAITGDVYVVERLRTQLVGEVVSPNRIEGRVEGSVEQVILGATNALFLGVIVSRPDPIAANSFFVLQRIDSAWSCDDILAQRVAVFGR